MATDPLAHIPGGKGPPLIGHMLSFLRDARRLLYAKQAEHGDVFQTRVLGRRDVVFLTPDATRQIYLDPLGAQSQAVNDSFVDMMAASVTPVRMNLPGTPYRRGVEDRRRLDSIFGELVEQRRVRAESADLLSRLSHANTESGAVLPADEVVDHMIFLLLAAHDTTTATLAVLLYELARNPDWQQRVADEVAGLDGADVTLDNHKTRTDTGNAMNEALRLSPPVPFSPRVALRVTVIDGWKIPAGTGVRHRLTADPRDRPPPARTRAAFGRSAPAYGPAARSVRVRRSLQAPCAGRRPHQVQPRPPPPAVISSGRPATAMPPVSASTRTPSST